jgi:hypothetical protein
MSDHTALLSSPGRDARDTAHPVHVATTENAGDNISQSEARAQLLRSAARRLRSIKYLPRGDAILRRMPSSAMAGTDDKAQNGYVMEALRTLLASDLPLEELVRMSFQPTLLNTELRRIRTELGREVEDAPSSFSVPSVSRAALRRTSSGSFSLDAGMALDCQAAALHGKRCTPSDPHTAPPLTSIFLYSVVSISYLQGNYVHSFVESLKQVQSGPVLFKACLSLYMSP